MKHVKFLVMPILFVALAFMIVGSCSKNEQDFCCEIGPNDCMTVGEEKCNELGGFFHQKSPCEAFEQCAPPPTQPPPTQPPPTQPPSQCQVPALNINFSDMLFVFIDEPNNVVIGVTSFGTTALILLADILIDPDIIVLGAMPAGPNLANIDSAIIEDVLLEATGDAIRVDNGSVIQIIDLIIAGFRMVEDLEGVCDSVEDIDTTASETLSNFMLGLYTRGLLKEDGLEDSPNHIENFVDELLSLQE